MKASESGEKKATRQCWECLKRRLVCDHSLPHCKKCQKAGKECPGYDEQKPLQWVETGKVTSRRRKKDSPPKIYAAPAIQKEQACETTKTSSESSVTLTGDEVSLEPVDFEVACAAWPVVNEAHQGHLAEDPHEKVLRELVFEHIEAAQEVHRVLQLGGRAKIEEVVAKGLHEEAAKMLQSKREPLKRLERLLWIMRTQDLPAYGYLSSETSEVVQAVNYYNSRIHPEVISAGELAPNPAVVIFPLHALHLLPPAVHHTLVCLALNHFIHRLPNGADRAVVVTNRSKVYHHRGAAIRALSHYVGKDKTRCSDLTIASIVMFMSMELQNPAFADWRAHASGMQRLLDMRGGLKALRQQAPYLVPSLIVYILIVALANTCSPSWDQIEISKISDDSIDDIIEMYSLMFPYTLCPPVLFFDMLRTNRLRIKASTGLLLCEMDPDHALEAHDLLARIEAFSPEDWAQPGTFYDEWLLIGTMYQSATAIYCTMSLQSLTVLPSTLEMNAMRAVHGGRLLDSLRAALKSSRVTKFIVWPLVVAGVEALYRSEGIRHWIAATLADLSHLLGTSSPLKARAVLRRYWQKGEPGWDECFDRPYVFII
ncbi:fungal-specific transcription factor domain-containing protein [Pyrenochaeta sp. MPI-SDFR-AT-0127]|nr:fungal-specific transcription factor domain-containing protein [Pyrenochaeta sp. MPI-SDFR-AT-0127]